jgi:hypothetical protein
MDLSQKPLTIGCARGNGEAPLDRLDGLAVPIQSVKSPSQYQPSLRILRIELDRALRRTEAPLFVPPLKYSREVHEELRIIRISCGRIAQPFGAAREVVGAEVFIASE